MGPWRMGSRWMAAWGMGAPSLVMKVSSEVASEERPRDLSLPPGGLTSGSRDDRVAPWHLRPVRW
jgi:prolyl oligopeptidase PreP (S9A serine peptidase family)